MKYLVTCSLLLSLTLGGCTSGSATRPDPGARAPETLPISSESVEWPSLIADQVAPRGLTPVVESHWSHPRFHVESATVQGATALNGLLARDVKARLDRFRASSVPQAGPIPVELTMGWAMLTDAEGIVGLRLLRQEFAGASTGHEIRSIYGTSDGRSAWTGPDLLDRQAAARMVALLTSRLSTAQPAADPGQTPRADEALSDVEFTRAGDLVVILDENVLGTGKGLVRVTIPSDAAQPLLTPAGDRVRASFMSSRQAPPLGKAPAVSRSQNAPVVDCAVKKCVALTFDDGPGQYTDKILDILHQHQARATFFMIGRNVQLLPKTAKRAQDLGMAIGDHTWTHPDLSHVDGDTARSEIARTASAIWNATGQPPVAVRPPYGAFTKETPHEGLPFILWDVDTEDWKNRNVEETTRRALDGARQGSIILMHDIHPSTAQALEGIVTGLQAKGFTLVTIPELIGDLDPDKAYFSATSAKGGSSDDKTAAPTPADEDTPPAPQDADGPPAPTQEGDTAAPGTP